MTTFTLTPANATFQSSAVNTSDKPVTISKTDRHHINSANSATAPTTNPTAATAHPFAPLRTQLRNSASTPSKAAFTSKPVAFVITTLAMPFAR